MRRFFIKMKILLSIYFRRIHRFFSRTYKKLLFIFAIVIAFSTCGYFQYQNIVHDRECGSVEKEISQLKKKIAELKLKEETLTENVTANNSELTELKNNLATLEQNLVDANNKLDSLK